MYPYDDPFDRWSVDALDDRVTHLVFVDGRLVDHWSEPALGSRWQPYADRFDRERRPATPPSPPPVPAHEQALRWLDSLCGGRDAVLALDDAPLTDDGSDLPAADTSAGQDRLAEVDALLRSVTGRCFDVESGHAFRHALLKLWALDSSTILHPATPGLVAGAIVWAIGKGNALLYPATPLTQRYVQEVLATGAPLSQHGRVVQRVLAGWFEEVAPPWTFTTLRLETLGHADLLLADTRRQLIRVRDRALAAQSSSAA